MGKFPRDLRAKLAEWRKLPDSWMVEVTQLRALTLPARRRRSGRGVDGDFGLVACGVYRLGLQTVLAAITFAGFGMPMLRGQCCKYAAAQVRAILADRGRAAEVRAAFAEALGTAGLGEAPQRLAA